MRSAAVATISCLLLNIGLAQVKTTPSLQPTPLDLGWLFKEPKHYGLLVHLDQNRNVRKVQLVD
jgi:hypothetical protein